MQHAHAPKHVGGGHRGRTPLVAAAGVPVIVGAVFALAVVVALLAYYLIG